MHLLGLPYFNAFGSFSDETNEGSVDLMLAAADAYPDLVHPVSFMRNDWIYNKYVDGALYYKLFYDNHDPDIVFTSEFSNDDIDLEKFAKEQKQQEEMMKAAPTLIEINMMRWRMEQHTTKKKA